MSGDLFRGLFDDASLFPPAALAMANAVPGHLRHRAAWYHEMSGPFVCPDSKITELSAALTAAMIAELDLALVLPGGAGGLDQAVDSVFADPRLRLRAVELPVIPAATVSSAGTGGSAANDSPAGNISPAATGGSAGADAAAAPGNLVADDPAGAVEFVADALDRVPLAGAPAFIEVPVALVTEDVARAAASRRYPIKLRTGGTSAATFPDEVTLAAALVALAGQRVPFKCTAGLHHAVRHRAADTGFEHHGFLNVLLAVASAVDGAAAGEVAADLADADPGRVAARVAQLDGDAAAAVRELFTSFGTCSTDEPVTDLVTLDLVTKG